MLAYNDHLEEYILAHIDEEPQVLKDVYRRTHLHHLYPRMCSGHYQGRLLKMLTAMINPQRVLELGTFTGYSTLAIAEGLNDTALIDTVEIDEEKEPELTTLFASQPMGDRIHLHIGDALALLGTMEESWDMVFIDANKRQYRQYLDAVLDKVPVGGFILADNTLWDMKVVGSNEPKDSQTRAIAEFNDYVKAHPRLEKVILPVRDGLTLMRRIS